MLSQIEFQHIAFLFLKNDIYHRVLDLRDLIFFDNYCDQIYITLKDRTFEISIAENEKSFCSNFWKILTDFIHRLPPLTQINLSRM